MQGGRDMLHGSRAEMRRYLGRYQAVSGDEKVDAPHHRRALPPGTQCTGFTSTKGTQFTALTVQ